MGNLSPPSSSPPRRRRRWLHVVAGLAVGLALTEYGFRVRDHGAFPHLNVYVPDAKLGVRLTPGATERISFSGNPVSSVRVNAAGYRGADWAEPGTRDVLVVGDSQAFGLGVDEDQTFAAELARKSGRAVVNAGVPTYGPAEYNAVVAELLPKRKSKVVVWTVNLANDLFEAAHPNTERHAVWDGWAVRRETKPAHVRRFPARTWLMRDSHAFFAARGLWLKLTADDAGGAVASEGTYRDLLSAGVESDARRRVQERAVADDHKRRDEAVRVTRAEVYKLNDEIAKALGSTPLGDEFGPGTLRAARAHPGDIVRVYYGEGSRSVAATAAEIKAAADLRKEVEDQLRKEGDRAKLDLLARADKLDEELRKKLSETPAAALRARSPLTPHLQRAKALCDAAGAELVVLVLPLDVQVSADEWKKYDGSKPLDMSATRVLADDVIAAATELGARVVDAWPVLAAAEPGAFLHGDLHMTERGHRAVGEALAKALAGAGATPAVQHAGPPPLGRTPVPTPDEWKTAVKWTESDGYVSDLQAAGCKPRIVREWLRIDCKGAEVVIAKAGRSEAMALNKPDGATLVAAMLEGDQFGARFRWPSPGAKNRYQQRGVALSVEWPLGESRAWPYASELYKPLEAHPPTADEAALYACHREVTGAADGSELYGAADAACVRTYPGDCQRLLACARGDASAAPRCAPGEQWTGATYRCAVPAPSAPPPSAAEVKQASKTGVFAKRRR
jgi:SGNH hydrolase-like domain, acetyltransferase AlgX